MKLIELLNLIDDVVYVTVFCNNESVGFYDGKNSIDEQLNNRDVVCVSVPNHSIVSGNRNLWIDIKEG